MMTETKKQVWTCTVCGGELARSADWGPEWLLTRYCSLSCSERRLAPLDYRLEEATLQLLGEAWPKESLSIAAVARFVDPLAWESLLERAHNAARRLAARGKLGIEGEGDGVGDPSVWGPDNLRLRLPN